MKQLNTKDILNNKETGRQTLGNLLFVLKNELDFFDNGEVQELLDKRNTFIHSFYKLYLHKKSTKKNELMPFILRLDELAIKYDKIFTGLIVNAIKRKAKELNGNIDFKGLEKDEENVIKYLIEQRAKKN